MAGLVCVASASAQAVAKCSLVPTSFVLAGVGKSGGLFRYEVSLWADSTSPASAVFAVSSVNAGPKQIYAPRVVLSKGEGGAFKGTMTFAISARHALGISVKQVSSRDGTSASCADAEHRIDGSPGPGEFDDSTPAAKALSEAEPVIEKSNDPGIFEHMMIANYPARERANGIQGSALVQVVVGNDGTVLEASVIRSSGHPGLDSAALDAAKSSTYVETKVQGKAAVGKYKTEYSFNLPL